jgi:hypothetical protein
MTKYCGVISVGAVAGGGTVSAMTQNAVTGQVHEGFQVPVAVELVSFKIGEHFFRKIRVCQQFVSQFIHPGENACIYVYKQMGITNVIVGVKSGEFPSYSISFRRFLLMIFAQYLFGILICVIPAFLLFVNLSATLALIATLALPTYGSWTLFQAYKEMKADFT